MEPSRGIASLGAGRNDLPGDLRSRRERKSGPDPAPPAVSDGGCFGQLPRV